MKNKYLLGLLVGFVSCCSTFSNNLFLTWNPSPVIPDYYTVYCGPSSYFYTNSVEVNTNYYIATNLEDNVIYYFSITVTKFGNQSAFSVQAVVGPNQITTNNILYIGSELVYGPNLNNLSTNITELQVMGGYNPNTFFGSSLLITNAPLFNMANEGVGPNYLGQNIMWGSNLSQITTNLVGFFIDTNNNDYYNSSLILTNQSF